MKRLARQGNLNGGVDEVRVLKGGRASVKATNAAIVQLTLDGRAEWAHTKRNPWTDEREAQDAREGKVAK